MTTFSATTSATTAPATTGVKNPYVGPRTFSYADRHLYFGREREARSLLARVVSARLLLFYAQSGAGKSSLINTRLIPQLREKEGFSVLPVGRVAGEIPAGAGAVDNIFVFNLVSTLDQGGADPVQLAHLTLSDFLEHLVTDDGLHWRYDPAIAVEATTQEAGAAPRFALVVDQFEEIVTTHPGRWQEREDFFRQLDAALLANPNLWVVLTLREDHVAALDPFGPLLFNRLRARFYMERMDVDAALEAVQEPARVHGRAFAPGVAEALVKDLSRIKVLGQTAALPGQYVEPVQLQVVCFQLWETLARTRPPVADAVGYDYITAGDVREAGDVDTALARFYEETLAYVLVTVPVGERQLRAWFDNQLITPTGTRGLVRQDIDVTGGLPNAVVGELQARFLVRSGNRAGGVWVELVHDRFVEPILEANRQWLTRNQNPLTQAAQAWQVAGRDRQLLYGGRALKDAQAELDSSPQLYGDLEREFLDAGRGEEERRAAQRRRWLAVGVTLLAVVLLALTGWALWSRLGALQARSAAVNAQATAVAEATRALHAEATAVNAQANAQANANLAATREAEAKAAEAEARSAEAEALAAQEQALAAKAEVERLTRGIRADQLTANALKIVDESPPLALLLAVEGMRAQSDYTTNAVSAEPVTSQITARFTHTAVVSETVVGSAQTNVHELLGQIGGLPLAGHGDAVVSVAFSPNGRWLATASKDNTARLWDVTNPSADPIVLAGHENWVASVAFSPDGRWLATASCDNTARLWDVTNPSADPSVLAGHENVVYAVAFSPDGRRLATASWDNTARLWDVTNPSADPVALASHENSVYDVTFSPDGRWLATASRDNTARLWDVTNPSADPIVLAGHEDAVVSVAFSPDGRQLATASWDSTARLWDVTNPSADPVILAGHENWVYDLAFNPDGRWLATASYDNTVRLWDVTNPSADPIVLADHENWVVAVVFSPDGRWLATASRDNTARLWDVTNPSADPIVLVGHEDAVYDVVFSPDGRRLATASMDAALLWNVRDPSADPSVLAGHANAVGAVAFSPEGRWLATVSDDNTARLWNVRDPSAAPIVLAGHEADVVSVAFSPDGRWLATASNDDTARLWDVRNPDAEPIVLAGHEADVVSVAFSPDGRWLATASWDATARLWDVRNPNADPIILAGHESYALSVAFSPDGRWLATASYDDTARLWDVRNPDAEPIVLAGHEDAIRSVVFSPDGRRLATASWDTTTRLWDVRDPGADPIVLAGHESYVLSVAFSLDGRWLATASYDDTVRLWDVREPSAEPIILAGHEDAVRSVAFSPNGRWLATASADTTTRLWDVTNSSAEPIVLAGHEEAVLSVVFSPNGRWLATASTDDTARLWRWQVNDMLAVACRSAGRNLTMEEWERYFQDKEYRKTCPQWPVHHSVTRPIRQQARLLAEQGDIAGATTKLREVLAIDPDPGFEPATEAKRIYASVVADEGRTLALQGEVDGATAKFEQALALDPTLEIEPEPETGRIYASVVADEGLMLALEGEVEDATAKFEQALALDPTLEIEPETEAKRIAAPVLVDQANGLAQNGEMAEAGAKLEQAQAFAQELDSVALHFGICRLQTLADLAKVVAPSCEALAEEAPAVEPGSLVTGTITGMLSEPWKLEVAAGSRVTITLEAAAGSRLDPYLILYDAQFKVIDEHDDIEQHVIRDSSLFDVALTQSGIYWIAAGRCCPNDDQDSVGSYVLKVMVKQAE